GACGLHAAPVSVEWAGISSAQDSDLGVATRGLQSARATVSNHSHQAGLNAVLADWPLATEYTEKSSRLLNNANILLGRLSHATIDDQDEFWSTFASTTFLDRITDPRIGLGN